MGSLRRVRELNLKLPDKIDQTVQTAAEVASLLERLSGLRRVQLDMLITHDATATQLLFHGLSSLPDLEELELCGNFPLPLKGVGPLGPRLRSLTVNCNDRGNQDSLGHRALGWIASAASQLSCRLESIELWLSDISTHVAALSTLLCKPPPRLQRLTLQEAITESAWTFQLDPSSNPPRVSEVRMVDGCGELPDLAPILEEILLPLRPPPRLVKLDMVCVNADRGGEAAALMQLQALAQKSAVHVDILRVEADDSNLVEWGLHAVAALGSVLPNWLDLAHDPSPVAPCRKGLSIDLKNAPALGQQPLVCLRRRDWAAMRGPETVALALELVAEQLGMEAWAWAWAWAEAEAAVMAAEAKAAEAKALAAALAAEAAALAAEADAITAEAKAMAAEGAVLVAKAAEVAMKGLAAEAKAMAAEGAAMVANAAEMAAHAETVATRAAATAGQAEAPALVAPAVAALAVPAAPASPSAAPPPAGAAEQSGTGASGHGHVRAVQVRGTLMARLARDPAELHAFVQRLALQAMQSARSARWWQRPVQSFMAVPAAGTLIMECTAKHAEAVAAAARAELAAVGCSDLGAVEVDECSPLDLLEQACEAVWHSGAGGSEAERLRLLLEMAAGLWSNWPVQHLRFEDD